jgi:hypothetical protein
MLRNSEPSTHVVHYTCTSIYKGVQLKSKLKHTGTWSEAAWPLRLLCYRPAVFFCTPAAHCACMPVRKNYAHVSEMLFNFLIFICLIPKLFNLKLQNSGDIFNLKINFWGPWLTFCRNPVTSRVLWQLYVPDYCVELQQLWTFKAKTFIILYPVL